MSQLILPVDAEQAVIDELNNVYTIATTIPKPIPAAFLRVVSGGGSQPTIVTDSALMTLEAFALTETAARLALADALARIQLAVSQGRLGNEVAYRLQIGALPQNFPLPTVPTHKRYISTIAVDLRRRVTNI